MSKATRNGVAAEKKSQSRFTLSVPPSPISSRPSTPTSSLYGNDEDFDDYPSKRDSYNSVLEKKPKSALMKASGPGVEAQVPGRRSVDVYDTTLSWWRAAVRRKLVKMVHRESAVIAEMQKYIRTPWLDAYFVYTSSLGTHTFFMTVLPAFFFFGYEELGRGLLIVLALGVYCSSVVKDLICSPRPFAPPVTRLTIGSHHLEYGFPSTHSTNSVSIALFLFAEVHRLATTPAFQLTTSPALASTNFTIKPDNFDTLSPQPMISPQAYTVLVIMLSWYTFSIVFGRLYTAMHSFTDCVMGVAMGTGIWWGHSSWSGVPVVFASTNPLSWIFSLLRVGTPTDLGARIVYLGSGLGAGQWVEDWVRNGGWEVPLILIPFCLFAVNQHPQPVDDCPCFEDAIAFGSVVLGALVGRWGMQYAGVGLGMGRTVVMPGSGWVFDLGQWIPVERTWGDVGLWWGVAVIKMVVGILVIFTWRLLAKSVLHLILPPTFRLAARVFRLPNRRFYTPATDYKNVPSEFGAAGRGGGFALRPIPSVIDLPGTGGVGVEVGGIGSGASGVANVNGREIKLRGAGAGSMTSSLPTDKTKLGNGQVVGNGSAQTLVEKEDGGVIKDGQPVKHYDADVLTKVFVYAGIAFLACEALPVMFEIVGWGVRSWVLE